MFQKHKRQRYTGSIPIQITRPIRAGLLESTNSNDLINLVAHLIEKDNQSDKHKMACTYISEVATHTRQQLLDGGFWWDDTYQRKNGTRYKHPIKPNYKRPSSHCTQDLFYVKAIGGGACGHPNLTICDDPAEHMWDDVLRAIHEDPRAFWGLWSTVIAPCLGPGVPETFKEKDMWTASNVDITEVVSRLMNLGRRLAGLIADNELILEEDQASVYGVILKNINNEALCIPGDEQLTSLKRAIGILLYTSTLPKFLYAMPVD